MISIYFDRLHREHQYGLPNNANMEKSKRGERVHNIYRSGVLQKAEIRAVVINQTNKWRKGANNIPTEIVEGGAVGICQGNSLTCKTFWIFFWYSVLKISCKFYDQTKSVVLDLSIETVIIIFEMYAALGARLQQVISKIKIFESCLIFEIKIFESCIIF